MAEGASNTGNGGVILDLYRPGRWSASRYSARCCLARRSHPLLHRRDRAKGGQPESESARNSDNWLQHWNTGIDVVVEGDAVQVTDNDALERLAKAWTKKWDRQWQYEVRDGAFHHKEGGAAIVFSVRPTKILA